MQPSEAMASRRGPIDRAHRVERGKRPQEPLPTPWARSIGPLRALDVVVNIDPPDVLFARNLERMCFIVLWCYKQRFSINSCNHIKTIAYTFP